MTTEDNSNAGSIVMQYDTSNCLVQQSWIRFHNTHNEEEHCLAVRYYFKLT